MSITYCHRCNKHRSPKHASSPSMPMGWCFATTVVYLVHISGVRTCFNVSPSIRFGIRISARAKRHTHIHEVGAPICCPNNTRTFTRSSQPSVAQTKRESHENRSKRRLTSIFQSLLQCTYPDSTELAAVPSNSSES